MRGLVIKSPWIDKILEGQKTWEMRSRPTAIRGEVALIKQGSGIIYGVANLGGSKGPLNEADLISAFDKHQIPPEFWSPFIDFKWRYAWVLSDVASLPSPVRYQHPSGAVIWVTLNSETVGTVRESLDCKFSVPNCVIPLVQAAEQTSAEAASPLRETHSNEYIRVPRSKKPKRNMLSSLVSASVQEESTEKVFNPLDRKPASLYRKKINQLGTHRSTAGNPPTDRPTSKKSSRPTGVPERRGKHMEIALTQGNINNGHIYLRTIKDWIPNAVIGGSNKSDLAAAKMVIDWGGSSPAFSDVAGDKMIFRSRKWVRDFFEHYQLKAGDTVSFEKLGDTSLKLRPVKGKTSHE